MADTQELTETLRANCPNLRLGPDARTRHRNAIAAELLRLGATARVEATPLALAPDLDQRQRPTEPADDKPQRSEPAPWIHRPQGSGRLLWLVLPVAAALLFISIRLAATESGPGDVLYPVNRASEDIVPVVDYDLTADDRLNDLEALIDRAANPTRIVEAQRAAATALSRLASGGRQATRYRALAIGAPDSAGNLDLNYRVELALGASPHGQRALSLPTGDIMSLSAAPPSIEVTGEWQTVTAGHGRWDVFQRLPPTETPLRFSVVVDNDRAHLALIDTGTRPGLPVESASDPLDVDDATLFDPEGNQAVGAASGFTATVPLISAGTSISLPPTTTTEPQATSRPPTTPTPTTTTSSTTATTKPPTTTTTSSTTTARPTTTTTACDDDDCDDG